MADLTGQRLGQYQILARISKGATSTIYKAYQPKLDRFVAVKVLSPQVVDEEGFLDRFTQEARAVAQLDHPNIVPVYDFDQVGDIAYIVFKYVEGGTLRKMMTGTPIALGQAVDIATQVGLALGYAHKRGVIHRDVKPSNILIGEGFWALLTDFGLAKIMGGGRKLTRSGIGMGTPDYMAPEQAQGIPGDGRSDLYSLGVVFYEMVTGRVPFEADSSMAVVVKHITEPPPPPRQFNPDLPVAVETAVLTAMEKDPDRRFSTAEVMVTALVRAAGQQERALVSTPDLAALSVARSARAESASQKGLPALVRKAWQRVKNARWSRLSWRSRMAISGVALIALVLLAVWGSLALRRPATQASTLPTGTPTRLRVVATQSRATTTRSPAKVTASATRASSPTSEPTDTPVLTPTETPAWIYLSPTAKIRPGIYVKAVKPDGVILRKGASFEKDYLTTLPQDTVFYVLQGPVRGNNLSWYQLSANSWVGWANQDEIVAYRMSPTP
jgi:serine/threonine protein kinase